MPAPPSVPARAGCCRRSVRRTAGTCTSSHREDSVGRSTGSTTSRPSTSSSAREPRPVRAGIFPAPRWSGESPRSAGSTRARRHLDAAGSDVSLIITGGLRTHTDFFKALALGADAVAVANTALQAIGCLGMRACNTDNCPVGIATQKPELRRRLVVDDAAERLTRFLQSTVELMAVLARACGRHHVADLTIDDLTTFDREMHHLCGVAYGGLTA